VLTKRCVQIIQLVHMAIGFYLSSLYAYLVHYSVYAANGYGVPGLLVCGEGTEDDHAARETRN